MFAEDIACWFGNDPNPSQEKLYAFLSQFELENVVGTMVANDETGETITVGAFSLLIVVLTSEEVPAALVTIQNATQTQFDKFKALFEFRGAGHWCVWDSSTNDAKAFGTEAKEIIEELATIIQQRGADN